MTDGQLVAIAGANTLLRDKKRCDLRGKLSLAHLPAMPQIMARLLDLCHRDDLNLGDLATLISRDAGLVTRIFAIASSAIYQRRSRPVTLEQCLSLLGVSMVKIVVINESVMQAFSRFTVLREVDLNRFWAHSLRCALLARELARKTGYDNPDEAYLGGLLHDIGRLAMLVTAPDDYKLIFRKYADGDELCALEQEQFGLNHAEVGAWLVEKWALDSFLGDCVLYHHEPAERIVAAPALVKLVLLANQLVGQQEAKDAKPDWNLLLLCGVAVKEPQTLLDTVERELAAIADHFGIKLAVEPPEPATPVMQTEQQAKDDMQFATRIQDILLVNKVLSDALKVEGLEFSLQAIALAMKVLFNLDAIFCFERTSANAECFRAKSLGRQSTRISQLEFVRGRSASMLARSLDLGPTLLLPENSGSQIIDDQILRAVGGVGVLLLPLRTLSSCVGVMVAAITTAEQVALLQERLPCLAHFGRLSAEQLIATDKASLLAQSNPDAAGIKQRVNTLIHEINNPLTIIRNYLTVLESENAGKGSAQPELAIVRDEVERISKMLRAAREDSNGSSGGVGKVQVNRVIDDLVTLFRGSIPSANNMDIRVGLSSELPEIVSDRDKLKQLLVNLLKNAVEAMPKGGKLRLTSAPWHGGDAGLSHIEICVEDTGPGLPQHVLSSMYQQVVSKKGGEHQGVGLAVVGQLVHELNGLINCRSDQDGTRFQILLPVVRQ